MGSKYPHMTVQGPKTPLQAKEVWDRTPLYLGLWTLEVQAACEFDSLQPIESLYYPFKDSGSKSHTRYVIFGTRVLEWVGQCEQASKAARTNPFAACGSKEEEARKSLPESNWDYISGGQTLGEKHAGIVPKWQQYGSFYYGSDYDTGSFVNFLQFGEPSTLQ